MKWYDIKAAANNPEIAEVSIFDEIGYWGIQAKDFIADLNKINAKVINVSINSPGGSVFDGLAIYNALRSKVAAGVEVNTKVMGIAASIASVILMAGDKREAPANAMVMVHNPWTVAAGNADELRETADVLDKIGASLLGVYTARTGKSEADIKALLAGDTYLSAEEAAKNGFITEVVDPVEVSASFDIEKLPEAVRKAVEQARASANTPEPKAPVAPFAEQVEALANGAGLGEFAQDWALAFTTVEQVDAAIGEAREIKALCKVAKAEGKAQDFIKARTGVAEVRAALLKARADADEHVDTSPKSKNSTATHTAGPVAVKTADIWAKHNGHRKEN